MQPLLVKGKVTRYSDLCSHKYPQSRKGEVIFKLKMADRKSCDLCPKTFAGSGGLYNHRQTHSGGKKYNCSQCNKSFSQAGDLKKHFSFVYSLLIKV